MNGTKYIIHERRDQVNLKVFHLLPWQTFTCFKSIIETNECCEICLKVIIKALERRHWWGLFSVTVLTRKCLLECTHLQTLSPFSLIVGET